VEHVERGAHVGLRRRPRLRPMFQRIRMPWIPTIQLSDSVVAAHAGGRGGDDAAAQTPESSLATALKKAATVGILWTSETVGYAIKYAYRLPQPDGGERIVLATDRRIGAWSNLWKPAGSVTPTDYAFSIIELRMNSKGEGDGKGAIVGKVTVDSQAKTIALDGYGTLPVVFKGVKRQ